MLDKIINRRKIYSGTPVFIFVIAILLFVLSINHNIFCQEYYALMKEWEQESGEKSRITIYAELELLDLKRPPQLILDLLSKAERDPFHGALDSLEPQIRTWQTAFEKLNDAWSIPNHRAFPYRDVLTPLPNMELIGNAARLLSCQAQLRALRGDLDGALSDAATVWLMGLSFTNCGGSFHMALIGTEIQAMGLRQMMAIVQEFPLGKDRILRLLKVLTSNYGKSESIIIVLRREIEVLCRAIIQDDNSQKEQVESAKLILSIILEKLDSKPYFQQVKLFNGFAESVDAAFQTSPRLASLGIPDARLALLRVNVVKAMENVTITSLLALRVRHQLQDQEIDRKPTLDEMSQYAGTLADRLEDPFSGNRLPILFEDDRISVVSRGPDGVIEPGTWHEYDPSTGLDGAGDIFLRAYYSPIQDKVETLPENEVDIGATIEVENK